MKKNSALLLNFLITIILIQSAKSIDCQDSEYIVTDKDGEQTCQLCNNSFVSSDKRNCQGTCLDEIRPVQSKKTCLALDTDCQTSYSKYEKKCYDEGECKLLGEKVKGKSYYLCKDCPIDRDYKPINSYCVKKCSQFQYFDKDLKQCLNLENCELYQDYQNSECVDECVGRKKIEIKKQNKKFCGCYNNYLFNLENQQCVPQCPKNTIKFNDVCLMHQYQCDKVISADGNECILKCPNGQLPAPHHGFYQCCEHFILSSTNQCVDDCSTGTQVKYGKLCLSHLDECPSFYDEKKNECQFWCDENKIGIQISNKNYQKCVCKDSSFLSINQIDCLEKCGDSQITYIIGKKCLENLYDCTGVISVDKQQCLPVCGPYQIARREKIKNHEYVQCIYCSGKKKYFEEISGVKRCVKKCLEENNINKSLSVCYLKEN